MVGGRGRQKYEKTKNQFKSKSKTKKKKVYKIPNLPSPIRKNKKNNT